MAIIAFSIPNVSSSVWSRPVDVPSFFRNGAFASYIKPGQIVVTIPFGARSDNMLWQAESGMYYRMAGGWTGVTPPEFHEWPILRAFWKAIYLPDATLQLESFMAHHGATTLLVDSRDWESNAWDPLLTSIAASKVRIGGITIYRLPEEILSRYGTLTGTEMAAKANLELFDVLVSGSDTFLAHGGSLQSLAPVALEEAHLLPQAWLTGPRTAPDWVTGDGPSVDDPHSNFRGGILIAPATPDHVAIGMFDTFAALRPVIEKYRHAADHVYFPYPHELSSQTGTIPADLQNLMIMTFSRPGLKRAAKVATVGGKSLRKLQP